MAVAATEENRADFELRRADLVRRQAEILATAEARAEALREVTLSVARRAGEGGRLFGSVGAADIAEAIQALGVEAHKNEVRLSEGPLRQVGEHNVIIHLQAGVDAAVTVGDRAGRLRAQAAQVAGPAEHSRLAPNRGTLRGSGDRARAPGGTAAGVRQVLYRSFPGLSPPCQQVVPFSRPATL